MVSGHRAAPSPKCHTTQCCPSLVLINLQKSPHWRTSSPRWPFTGTRRSGTRPGCTPSWPARWSSTTTPWTRRCVPCPWKAVRWTGRSWTPLTSGCSSFVQQQEDAAAVVRARGDHQPRAEAAAVQHSAPAAVVPKNRLHGWEERCCAQVARTFSLTSCRQLFQAGGAAEVRAPDRTPSHPDFRPVHSGGGLVLVQFLAGSGCHPSQSHSVGDLSPHACHHVYRAEDRYSCRGLCQGARREIAAVNFSLNCD